ncbi:MAG: type II toxin-antitoxin system VapC family toxin [Bacteroidota bacterium]
MYLLDSNLIIYAGQAEHEPLRQFIEAETPLVSEVSRLEALGYHKLGGAERGFLEAFFDAAVVLPISRAIVDRAIELRQQRTLSLGDAFIGATALEHGLTLATRNVKDFAWIAGLQVTDPLAS